MRVDAHGSFLLRNLKPVPVALCLKLTLTGELSSSSERPTKSIEIGSGSDLANSHLEILFDVKLAPRESRTIKYKRSYYVRN